jgi:hypothetical protein
LKASKRVLKLQYDEPFSNFAFEFNLRRCSTGARGRTVQVDPIKPKLELPGTKRLKLKCEEPLSKFGFKFNVRRYTVERVDVRGRRSGRAPGGAVQVDTSLTP